MKHCKNKTWLLVAVCAAVAYAQEAAQEAADMAEIARRVAETALLVEYHLKYDGDTAPYGMDVSVMLKPCPNCGGYHGRSDAGDTFMNHMRPYETMGWLVAPDMLRVNDPGIQARFIESVKVVLPDGSKVGATEHAIYENSPELVLKLEKEVREVRAVPEVREVKKGWLANFARNDAEWTLDLGKFDIGKILPEMNENGEVYAKMTESGLFFSPEGEPAGFVSSGVWNPEKPFEKQDSISARDLDSVTGDIADKCLNGGGAHVATLNFRSPREDDDADDDSYLLWGSSRGGNSEQSTIQHAAALHLAPGRLLVLASLKPEQTARLESVAVRETRDGEVVEVPATFAASLRRFGAFVADAPELVSAPLTINGGDLRRMIGTMILCVHVNLHGDKPAVKTDRLRLKELDELRNGSAVALYSADNRPGTTLGFTARGGLALVSLDLREKFEGRIFSEWSSSGLENVNHDAAALAAIVADLPAGEIDTMNVPLAEDAEKRIAWLGVELQELDDDLAQMLGVAELSETGERYSWRDNPVEHDGGVVAFVYPGSPAERAGLREGDVILRIISEERALPYTVKREREYRYGGLWGASLGFYEYEDDDFGVTLWPSAYNDINKTLTEIGFGKRVRLVCWTGGELKEVPVLVEESPPTYENAARYEAKEAGLVVRDMTYEVRNYLKLAPDAPGVVVSRVERGEAASIAGVRANEIIVRVDDAPVGNVHEFEKLIEGKNDFQLTVRLINRDRIVRIKN